MQSFIFYFFMGIKSCIFNSSSILLLLMMKQIKQSATNQAMNKLKKLSNMYHIKLMKLCAANWTDLTICNKLSNKTNHVMCNKKQLANSYKLEIKQCVTNFSYLTNNK